MQVDDKLIAMIYMTLISRSVIGVSIIKQISPTVQSIVEPAITGLLGAAVGRVTTELKVNKSEKNECINRLVMIRKPYLSRLRYFAKGREWQNKSCFNLP